jgi:hypothetical protein
MSIFKALFSVVAFAVALSLSSCLTVSMPTAAQAGIRFETKAEPLPADLEWGHRAVAHELINAKEIVVVVSGGSNPISDTQWVKYNPPLPWTKNMERNLLFSQTFFMRSPNAPADATGDDRYTFREISGHTWLELAQPVAVDLVPAGEKTDWMKPAPGHLVIKTIRKPQVMRWDGPIYRLTDGHGNYYVMHATETGTPTLDVALPALWSLEKAALAEPLVITPSQGGYYNIVGDCLGQGYHQYVFADSVYPAD